MTMIFSGILLFNLGIIFALIAALIVSTDELS